MKELDMLHPPLETMEEMLNKELSEGEGLAEGLRIIEGEDEPTRPEE